MKEPVAEPVLTDQEAFSPAPPSRFLTSVLWNWLGVGVSLFIGFVLSPIIVRRLGAERYGIWALVFALLDYFWFFDFGMNTAIVNFSARYRTANEPEKLNELINTALAFFSVISVVLVGSTLLVSSHSAVLFPGVSPIYRVEFSRLILLTGLSWSGFVLLHIFTSCLDGFQRFELTSRAWIAMLMVRGVGCLVLVLNGYGLLEMAVMVVIGQLLCYLVNFWNFSRIFPGLRFGRVLIRWGMFREMTHYGVHSFVATAANLLLNQGPALVTGHLLPTAFVGFFSLPLRLLQYGVDAVSRVGIVTRSRSAALDTSEDYQSVLRLGIYTNRYCFAIFMPVVLFLLLYGKELITKWISAEFAANSAPLLPILAPAVAIAMAGQFNSSSILFGLGKHQWYSRVLLAEAVVSIALMWLVIPQHGILGAAWVVSILMLLSRGIITPWIVSRSVNVSFGYYMNSIYMAPVLTAAPIFALGWFLKSHLLAGANWIQLGAAAVLLSSLYLVAALFTCMEAEHRQHLWDWVRPPQKTIV
jgi:O-antigen/teichoic acid export membrane protein